VGLEPGESFQQLAKMPAGQESYLRLQGRVLDAFTGRPLAGAKIEVWSEEIDRVFGGYHRFGESRSGRDGRFVIRQQVGSMQAEKSRVSAPGYLTLSGTRGDLYHTVRLFPRMAQSPHLRILDLEGRPIAGARITSTYTCAHDVPAFDLRTGVDGVATLPEFGLQADVQELRIRAPGYQAIKYLDGEVLFATRHAGSDAPHDIHLARQRPFGFRIINSERGAIPDLPIQVQEGEGYHVGRTGKHGLLTIESRYGSGECDLRILGGLEPRYIANYLPPVGRVPTLRRASDEWPKQVKTGTIQVVRPALGHKQARDDQSQDLPPMQLFHEKGWSVSVYENEDGEGLEQEFPAGKGFLVVGGPFTGHEQEILDFDLEPGKTLALTPRLTPEPAIQIRSPAEGDWTLTIQAGEDSKPEIAFAKGTDLTLPSPIPVPGNRELVLYLQGEGRRIRKTLPMARTGMKIDFDKELAALNTKKTAAPIAKREIRFVAAATGKPLKGKFSISFGQDCQQTPSVDTLQDHFELRGPVGNAWLARFDAEGYNTIYLRGRLQKNQTPLLRKIEATASLKIQAPFAFKILGDDALDLDALPPGPLGLVLLLDNGRRYGLELRLAPGAHRKIQIR